MTNSCPAEPLSIRRAGPSHALLLLAAPALLAACEPVAVKGHPLGQTINLAWVDSAELTRLRPVARAAYREASGRITQAIERDLARGPGTPPLNLATLRVNYHGDPDPMERTNGTRITAAAGLLYLDEQPRNYGSYSAIDGCKETMRSTPAIQSARDTAQEVYRHNYTAQLAAEDVIKAATAQLCHDAAAEDTATSGTGVRPELRRRLIDTYIARRQAELRKVGRYLETQIGFGARISADEERAVTYLVRLADAVRASDGAIGAAVESMAARASRWRDARIDAGAITADMAEELAMREQFGRMAATFRRNQALSDREAAAKAKRTPVERDSVRIAVCAQFGITAKQCPP